MKKIQILYFIFIVHAFNCFATRYSGYGSDMAANAGVEAIKIAAPIIEKTGEHLSTGLKEVGLKTIQAALPAIDALQGTVTALSGKLEVVSDKLSIALENAGANAGIAVADKIGSTFHATCVVVKSAGISVQAAAMAHPVVTTVIVGTVVVVILAYGSYKIYRYYRPKTAQIEEAKMKLEIAKAEAEINKLKKSEERSQKEAAFKKALIQHASSALKTSTGIPAQCQRAAHELAIIAGQKKVDKIVASFKAYAPQAA